MSDQFTGDYSNYNSYNAGTLIQPGRRGPPPPTMTQLDQNLQSRQVLHERDQNGQYIDEKNITSHGPFPEVLNGQRPMTIVDPTYDQHIIKPPKANVTHGRIPDIEIICSEDRNFTTYPNPSEYIIKLKDIYKNVTSITLFNACIPNTGYLVDKRNNLIYFRESCCEKLVAEIPPGDYVIGGADPEVNLTMAIKKAMDNVGESTYTVIVDNLTHKFIITSDLKGGDHIFSLDFYGSSEKHDTRTRAVYPQRSIGKIIGFPRKNFLYATGIVNVSKKSKTITGNSETLFKEEFSTGDKFYIEELC